jgi:hypothetical protein
MGYGKCGWVMAKGKEIKEMRRWVPVRPELSGQMSLRADCWETPRLSLDSRGFRVPGFNRRRELNLVQLSWRTIAQQNLHM